MGRSPCCSKEGLNRGAWTATEDKILTDYVKTHGEGKWRNLPKKAGLMRCGKSCRLRWLNYLRPDIKRGNITRDEEELIVRLHRLLGNRWSLIAGRLPGRTDNEIKNYWNTKIGKKMQAQKSSALNHNPSNQSEENSKPATHRSVDLAPPETDQLGTKPVVGPSTVQDLADSKVDGPESWPLTSMMDLEMDEQFLSEFLYGDFSQLCDFDHGLQGDNNTSTSHGSHSSPKFQSDTLVL
ncbi:hypothetical protein L1049_005071 [Liquidambar formosana]|uniref:Myb-related protein 123 n=1 Tax=Liquidambar formosana TaxID=63359 RepID=A0AAP0WWB4_LIQFO